MCDAAIARGWLTRAQVAQALAQAGPQGPLAALAALLSPGQVQALREVHAQASAAQASAAQASAAQASAASAASAYERTREGGAAPPTSARIKLAPGAAFGPFQLVRELGRGGMGAVWLAEHAAVGRQVALKVLLDEDATGVAAERFLVEARAAAKLDHRALVAVLDVGRLEGRYYMTQALIDGESLDARLKRSGPLPPDEAARVVHELALGMAHAHERGVLHRDLKPSNVLLDARGQPLVTDFGLARDLQGASDLTKTGQVLGTPAYMSPEQADGLGRHADARTDVYGLGAILYAALCGRAPFTGSSVVAILQSVANDPPRPPSQVLERPLPPALEALCLRCLAKAPAARPPSAAALAEELQACRRGQAAAPARGGGRGLAAFLVTLGIGLGVGVGASALRSSPAPAPSPSTSAEEPDEPPPAPGRRPAPPAARASDPLPRGELLEGPGWALVNGLTLEELHGRFEPQQARGLAVASIAFNLDGSPYRLSAAWVADPAPYEVVYPDDPNPGEKRRTIMGEGYRWARLAVFPGADKGAKSLMVFAKDERRGSWDMNRTPDYVQNAWRKNGARKLWLDWIATRDFTHPISSLFAADVPETELLVDLSRAELAAKLIELSPAGWLGCTGPYVRGTLALHAALWRRDEREGLTFFEQPAEDLRATAELLGQREGYRPAFLNERGPAEAPLHCSTWVRDPRACAFSARGDDPLGLSDAVRDFLAAHDVPRAALAVVRAGRLVQVQGYGQLPARAQPTEPWSRFRLAGLSSLVTAAAALRLCDRGALALDRPLAELLPDLAPRLTATDARARAITLRHLLQQRAGWDAEARSGLPDAQALQVLGQVARPAPRGLAAVLDEVARAPLARAPGAERVVSARAALLLGEVVARAGQGPYAEVARRLVLGPLDLRTCAPGRTHAAGCLPEEVGYAGTALALDPGGRGVAPAQYAALELEPWLAARGWVCSAPDLARLLVALAGEGTFLKPDTRAALRAEELGLQAAGEGAQRRLWLSARMPGSFAHVEQLPGGAALVLLLARDAPGEALVDALRARLERVERWPADDLFARY